MVTVSAMSNASPRITKGLGLFPTEPVDKMREYTLLADSLGYDNVWYGDSQNLWREVSVTIGACSVGTKHVVLGAGVTNAVTRHRSVVASTWATLAEMTCGRAALGIGIGDSSLRTMGRKPLKLAELEEAIAELRTLFAGRSVHEQATGSEFQLSYLRGGVNVPIYIGASAPRILGLSGRIADGVIALVGTTPRFIHAALGTIEAGAKTVGRTLKDLHIVLWTPTAIDRDSTRARDLVRAHVSRAVIRPLPAEIDPNLQKAVDHIRENYDYQRHMDTRAGHADLVPDELVDQFALAGTPEECRERLTQLTALGVDQVAIVPFVRPGGSRATTIRAFAEIAEEL